MAHYFVALRKTSFTVPLSTPQSLFLARRVLHPFLEVLEGSVTQLSVTVGDKTILRALTISLISLYKIKKKYNLF